MRTEASNSPVLRLRPPDFFLLAGVAGTASSPSPFFVGEADPEVSCSLEIFGQQATDVGSGAGHTAESGHGSELLHVDLGEGVSDVLQTDQ
jgi:hypothetical protein